MTVLSYNVVLHMTYHDGKPQRVGDDLGMFMRMFMGWFYGIWSIISNIHKDLRVLRLVNNP